MAQIIDQKNVIVYKNGQKLNNEHTAKTTVLSLNIEGTGVTSPAGWLYLENLINDINHRKGGQPRVD